MNLKIVCEEIQKGILDYEETYSMQHPIKYVYVYYDFGENLEPE